MPCKWRVDFLNVEITLASGVVSNAVIVFEGNDSDLLVARGTSSGLLSLFFLSWAHSFLQTCKLCTLSLQAKSRLRCQEHRSPFRLILALLSSNSHQIPVQDTYGLWRFLPSVFLRVFSTLTLSPLSQTSRSSLIFCRQRSRGNSRFSKTAEITPLSPNTFA